MWHTDFLSQLINVEVVPGKIKVRFTSAEGETKIEPPVPSSPASSAGRGRHLRQSLQVSQSVVSQGITPKITIPSPSTCIFAAAAPG
jgi:5-methyltetrahydropteroyltriglutamate--homocysteine methyltransferase